MITQDKLAAATIAKIFGSELLHAQQNARTDGGAMPNFVTIHPKDILERSNSPQDTLHRSQREKQMMEMLQREAEAACPLPQEQLPANPSPTLPTTMSNPVENQQPVAVTTASVAQPLQTSNADVNVWERINFNLERIANRLEKIDFSAKKAKIKKKVLNENSR